MRCNGEWQGLVVIVVVVVLTGLLFSHACQTTHHLAGVYPLCSGLTFLSTALVSYKGVCVCAGVGLDSVTSLDRYV